jgi:hypothetical protein
LTLADHGGWNRGSERVDALSKKNQQYASSASSTVKNVLLSRTLSLGRESPRKMLMIQRLPNDGMSSSQARSRALCMSTDKHVQAFKLIGEVEEISRGSNEDYSDD